MDAEPLEKEVKADILRRLPSDVVLWNVPTGVTRYGDRVVPFGMCPGGADLIGIKTVIIQPHHLGQHFGRFVALEVKRPVSGRASEEQLNFIDVVRRMGGLAGIARSATDALCVLSDTLEEYR